MHQSFVLKPPRKSLSPETENHLMNGSNEVGPKGLRSLQKAGVVCPHLLSVTFCAQPLHSLWLWRQKHGGHHGAEMHTVAPPAARTALVLVLLLVGEEFLLGCSPAVSNLGSLASRSHRLPPVSQRSYP